MNVTPRSPLLRSLILGLIGITIEPALSPTTHLAAERDTGSPPIFQQAMPGYEFVFPRDHGSHDVFLTEWWYFTGHLVSTTGERFGYELTFFRRAVEDPQVWKNPSRWALRQVYFAHFALTEVDSQRFRYAEKISRAGIGKAGAKPRTLNTWVDHWSVAAVTPDHQEFHLQAATQEFSIDLLVRLQKPPVIHGLAGVSEKGNEPGQASHYYSLTRLATKGTVRINGQHTEVTGTSWMDHEFGSSDLAQGVIGWDWFGLQLQTGYEIMAYWLRRQDGTFDPVSSGTLVAPDGETRHLSQDELKLEILEHWESQASGARYPSRWTLTIVPMDLRLTISPHVSDQELRTTKSTQITYWEGAVEVEGRTPRESLTGMGYVELTGYAEPYKAGS